jgi:hypothetical protein
MAPRPSSGTRKPPRPPLPIARIEDAFARLARQRALQTLVRAALPVKLLKRMLKDAMPRRAAAEMPEEVWANLAVGIALESSVFAVAIGRALDEHLAWDQEPNDIDAWWERVVDRPLEALWMAARSETKAIRKEFGHIAEHCLENFRNSPAAVPPSWEFVEAVIDVQAQLARTLRDAEKQAEDAERRGAADRERLEELREELKRLRRETGDLRAENARFERRAEQLATQQRPAVTGDKRDSDELERRLRKAEKEREHLWRELERLRPEAAPAAAAETPRLLPEAEPADAGAPLTLDTNPRRRVLRQMLRKLFKKGKIGASHTHEDNVFRGLADHEKGIAKEAIELLYREDLLVPKPTAADPHVSLNPDRIAEVRALIAGAIDNPRIQRFVGSEP